MKNSQKNKLKGPSNYFLVMIKKSLPLKTLKELLWSLDKQ